MKIDKNEYETKSTITEKKNYNIIKTDYLINYNYCLSIYNLKISRRE